MHILLVAQVWQLGIVQQADPVEDGTKLPEQELQVFAALQVTQFAIVQAKHWFPAVLGRNPEAQDVQKLFVEQVWQFCIVQQEAPLTEGKKPDEQELQVFAAEHVWQLVIVQEKQVFPAVLGRNPDAHVVQTVFVEQLWQLLMAQHAAPSDDGTKLPEQELQVLAAEQVKQLAIVQVKHELPAALGSNPEAHWVQTFAVEQVWQFCIEQQAAPPDDGNSPPVHEVQTPTLEQVAQLVIVQLKHWLPSAFGKKLLAHCVQAALLVQAAQFDIAQHAAPLTDGTPVEQVPQTPSLVHCVQDGTVHWKHTGPFAI